MICSLGHAQGELRAIQYRRKEQSRSVHHPLSFSKMALTTKQPHMESKPLLKLREELQRQNLTGFIIPHADEYQNEYLPAYAERLAWVTGFTGSAGTAIVVSDDAAIFVDGRYTLQVGAQVDSREFSPHHSGEVLPHVWLEAHVGSADRIGFDPRLHTPKDLECYQKACERVGTQLLPCPSNPVDAVWMDQPNLPLGLVVPHPQEYSGQSSQHKREKIVKGFAQDRIHAAIISAPDSLAWLLNIRGADVPHTPLPLGYGILYDTGRVSLFLHPEKVGVGLQAHLGEDVTLNKPEGFQEALEQMGKQQSRVLCDPARTNMSIWATLEDSGAHLIHGADPCALPKACKNPTEIRGAQSAHIRDGIAMCQFLAWLAQVGEKSTITELEAAAYLDECRRKQPLWEDSSFPTISGAGSNGAIVHYHSTMETNRLLVPGILYLVDSGGQYLDGTTDITRTVAIGTPTSEQQDRYTRVLQGHIALATATFPEGTTGTQLDALARRPLWARGLDYDHGTGHGVGSFLGVHEGPQRIAKSASTVALRPGMILSNEPGYYKTGEYGIRLENLVVVTKEVSSPESTRQFLAFETLTVVPFDRTLIAPTMLNNHEREWVNTYHAQVWEKLNDQIEGETRIWLEEATQPIP